MSLPQEVDWRRGGGEEEAVKRISVQGEEEEDGNEANR